MSEIQPSQETLKEILSYFNQDNFLKAEELANTLIKEYSNNIFLLKILVNPMPEINCSAHNGLPQLSTGHFKFKSHSSFLG